MEKFKKEPVLQIEHSIIKTYRKEIWSPFMKAITKYELIEPNDHIAVCISGGKDSMLLAKCFQILSRFTKIPFSLTFLVMDPGYHEENRQQIENNAAQLGIPIVVRETQIFDAVYGMDRHPCYVCARMRRGYLYRFAKELGCNKIALGHHFDDVIETTLMNVFYSGEIRGMMPKLPSKNFAGMELIRPLYLVKERDIIRWKTAHELRFLQCACRFTEMVEKEREEKVKTSKRDEIKTLIREYRKHSPIIEQNIFKCMDNVNLDKVLSYYDENGQVSFLQHYEKMKQK